MPWIQSTSRNGTRNPRASVTIHPVRYAYDSTGGYLVGDECISAPAGQWLPLRYCTDTGTFLIADEPATPVAIRLDIDGRAWATVAD